LWGITEEKVKNHQQMQKILKEILPPIPKCYVESITHLEGEEAL